MAFAMRAGAQLLLATARTYAKLARQIDGDAPILHCHHPAPATAKVKKCPQDSRPAGNLGNVRPLPKASLAVLVCN